MLSENAELSPIDCMYMILSVSYADNKVNSFSIIILNLKNIMLREYAFNVRALKCYESIGFRVIGKR